MEWKPIEDYICCILSVNEYVYKKSEKKPQELIEEIKRFPVISHRDDGTIRMRLQNIKAVFNSLKIENTLNLTALENCAVQTETIIKEIFKGEEKKWKKLKFYMF